LIDINTGSLPCAHKAVEKRIKANEMNSDLINLI